MLYYGSKKRRYHRKSNPASVNSRNVSGQPGFQKKVAVRNNRLGGLTMAADNMGKISPRCRHCCEARISHQLSRQVTRVRNGLAISSWSWQSRRLQDNLQSTHVLSSTERQGRRPKSLVLRLSATRWSPRGGQYTSLKQALKLVNKRESSCLQTCTESRRSIREGAVPQGTDSEWPADLRTQ